MVKFWETTHGHDYPWSKVASAYWSRYPNPNSVHVFSEDFIEHNLSGEDNSVLRTKRFIMKTNSLPSWGRHFFSTKRVPLVEEAMCDAREKKLVTYTRNIGLRYFMGTTERVTYSPHPDHPETQTLVKKEVWIESEVFGFQTAINKFGVDRFKKNCVRASEGFEFVLKKFYGKDRIHVSSSMVQGKDTKINFEMAAKEQEA